MSSLRNLAEEPFFRGMDAATTDLLAGYGVDVHLDPDEVLFRAGEPADRFFVVRRGRVAIEVSTPGRPIVLDTVEAGDAVGWSWLVPPYRWTFDARALHDTSAVCFDAARLRTGFAHDPALGYRLTSRFVALMGDRLQAARLRLLDMYGDGHGSPR